MSSRRRTMKKRGGDPHRTMKIEETNKNSVYMVCQDKSGNKSYMEALSPTDTCGIYGTNTGKYLAWKKQPNGTMLFNKDYPTYDAAKAVITAIGGRRKRKTYAGCSRKYKKTKKYW